MIERFDDLYGLIPCGVALVDGDGRILRANDAMAGLAGQPAAALTGQPMGALLDDAAAFAAVLAQAGAGEPVRDALLTLGGKPLSGRARRLDPAGILLTLVPVPALDDLRSFFDFATEGMYRSSPDGHMLRANPALVRLNGYETEEQLLAGVGDIAGEWYVDPGRREQFVAQVREGPLENFESQVYRHRTREKIWISENARLVRDATGRPLYYEGTVTDISARRRVEDRLRAAISEAQRASIAKSEFLANMSHELRTPLNAILGFSEMMLTGTFGPLGNERYAAYLKDINDSAGLLLQLIEDILDVSRAEVGRLKLEENPVDIAALIAAARSQLASRANARGVQMIVEAAPDLPALRCDERRLRQIVTHLLSNAVKFAPAGSTVFLSCGLTADGALRIAVRDCGPGIPEEDLARIFEPFVQVEGIMQRSRDGAGLGLPLCRALAEAHGGSLNLLTQLGQGTEAELLLPASRIIRTNRLSEALANL